MSGRAHSARCCIIAAAPAPQPAAATPASPKDAGTKDVATKDTATKDAAAKTAAAKDTAAKNAATKDTASKDTAAKNAAAKDAAPKDAAPAPSAAPASLRFMLCPTAGGVCRVEWQGSSKYTADELVSRAEPPEDRAGVHEATDFLRTLLCGGPLSAERCLREARAASISEKTLRRAKLQMQVRSIRENHGPTGRWLWILP